MNVKDISTCKIIFPIRLVIEPMERLLIASFKGDPEFEAIEPQSFNDPINGKGIRVLCYRKDKKVDVYWQSGVCVNRNSFTVGAGLNVFEETTFKHSCFEVDDKGINVHIQFTDSLGRCVELLIREDTTKTNRMPFLAPVGNDIEKPKQLFLVYMLGFDFIRRKKTKLSATIGGRTLKFASFPILRNFQKVLFTRYSVHPVIAAINPPCDTPVIIEKPKPGKNEASGMELSINENNSIDLVSSKDNNKHAEIKFVPAFPNIADIQNNIPYKGSWTVEIAGAAITFGTYLLVRRDGLVNFEFDVTGLWKPSHLPMSFKIFTRIASFFRTWPSTYRYKGIIDIGNVTILSGAWERKRK